MLKRTLFNWTKQDKYETRHILSCFVQIISALFNSCVFLTIIKILRAPNTFNVVSAMHRTAPWKGSCWLLLFVVVVLQFFYSALCLSPAFSSKWSLSARQNPQALYPFSQPLPPCCLSSSSIIGLVHSDTISSIQNKSSAASRFLCQAVDGVLSLFLSE